MKIFTISIEKNSVHSEVASEIEENLLQSLAVLNNQSTNTTIVLSARSAQGEIVGGVSGSTSYGWLLVKLLWVNNNWRGAGIGKKLMLEAEELSRSFGCHSAWLDTSNPLARKFYHRLGYSDFGILNNGQDKQPAEHNRWFLSKVL